MDTQKGNTPAGGEVLARFTGKKVVVGAKQLRKALLSGSAQLVCLARSADPAITEPIEALCQQKNVEYAWVPSMTDLGSACGIDLGAAAAAAASLPVGRASVITCLISRPIFSYSRILGLSE